MSGSRIITGVSVAEAIEPRLTVDSIRAMLQDMRDAKQELPRAIYVSEYDRRELNQDLMAGAVHEVAKEDQRPEHDGAAIGIIEGIPVKAHPDIPRGKCRLVYPTYKPGRQPTKLGGEGLIIVGAS